MAQVTPATAKDLMTPDPHSGLNSSGLSTPTDQRSLSSKIPQGYSRLGMATILKDLSQIGYICEWETIPAYCLGLPLERERVFIITYPNGLFHGQQPTSWADQIGNHIAEVRLSHEIRSYQPGVLAVAHGVSIGVAKKIPGNFDARRAFGLSCSPRQAAVPWKRIHYLCSLMLHQEVVS
ncbi:DNA cytosine methyltransferase (plasmid) [Nostoc sp. UHCC 0870]|nr:DNA cytosine methyltransferase [Nostoc sp. UHCC 0870]UKP01284.1 DNA cytosine methyltransferase [Nostoc sp. UHCC 0870]